MKTNSKTDIESNTFANKADIYVRMLYEITLSGSTSQVKIQVHIGRLDFPKKQDRAKIPEHQWSVHIGMF